MRTAASAGGIAAQSQTGTQAISDPSDSQAERARALFFEGLERADRSDHAGAEACFRTALELVPDRPSILTNLAATLFRQSKIDEALAFAERASALEPDNDEAALVIATCWMRRHDFEKAGRLLEAIVARDPEDAEAWAALGTCLAQMRRHPEAVAAYRCALTAQPDIDWVRGDLVSARMYANDWVGIEQDWTALLAGLRNGLPVARPFQVLSIPCGPDDQLAAARLYCAREFPPAAPMWRGERYAHERIRLAYVCADFGQHPTAQLMVGLFEQHDRTRFETIAIATAPDDGSALRGRMAGAFERFIEAGNRSDRELATLMREMEIDIAVDLNAHTTGARTGAFALRPAPIQVSYLVYPGTMGADFIDYLIADPVVVPAEHRRAYAEKVVWLPESYFVNDDARGMPETGGARADHGLPASGFVFCCFNNSYKITPDAFDVWMRLLTAVEGSVLWLLESSAASAANLRRAAEARGIPAERLVFAPRVSTEAHLARLPHADLFLDTLHYNAHTTACEAMWMGLPVLTCTGNTFAGRVGASLAGAIGLPELAAANLAGYESLALALARDPDRLGAIRARLAANRTTWPLFDTRRSARHVEAAYMEMIARHRRGAPPEGFAVPAVGR